MIRKAEIASRLRSAAALASTRWDAYGFCVGDILDRVAPASGRPDGVDLWDAVVTHLGEELTVPWERQPGRTRADVAAMLRAAAQRVEVSA